ncbi:MAG: hypothetical protein AAF546_09500 [Verrucomicrobiota bacterium]
MKSPSLTLRRSPLKILDAIENRQEVTLMELHQVARNKTEQKAISKFVR